MRPLDPPPNVDDNDTAHEMVRFWIADEECAVALNIGLFEPEIEPQMWGSILADIALHAIEGMQQDRPDAGQHTQLLAEIEAGFANRLNENPAFTGTLQGSRH